MNRWPLVVLLVGVAQIGCYKPNIRDGGLKCNLDAGPAKACPEGFFCNSDQFCVKHPTDGGVEKSDADGGPPDVPPPCYDARPNCTPGAGMCDPFCQTGCGCREKCSINTMATLTCEEVAPGATPALYAYCNFLNYQAPTQTDDCAPGQVCLTDNCSQHCYQFCRDNNDCTNAACDREVVDGGQKVCDVPFVDGCVPLIGTANRGCTGGMNVSCYLSSANPDRTICDCPGGSGGANAMCKHSRDCVRGLACVDRQNGTPSVCLQVCRLGADGGVDGGAPGECNGNPAACRRYYGNPAGSTYNPTYGFCF
jgi:hypothetical protein